MRLSEAAERNAEVRTEPLTPGRFVEQLVVPANLEADPHAMARLGSRAGGRVVAVHVHLGQAVREGDALFELDSTELHNTVNEFLVAVARSRAASLNLARQRRLTVAGASNTVDIERAQAEEAVARANASESEEHLHFLGLTEGEISGVRSQSSHGNTFSRVRSPIAGNVASLEVTVGQVVAGTEEVVTIARRDALWAVLHVPERDALRMRPGLTVHLRAVAEGSPTFDASVSFVADAMNPATRSLEARAPLDAVAVAQSSLRLGMAAVATIELPGALGALLVPAESVQRLDGQSVVFVRTGERQYTPRAVRVGPEHGGVVPVLEGLRAGEPVVVHGAFALRGELARGELEGD